MIFSLAGILTNLRRCHVQIENFGILTNLRRCHVQIENLEKLIFVNKNWPNECRVSCKSPFNLLKLIRIDEDLKEELEQFGGAFERDEILDL
jgi:hypothetical protein